MEYKTGQEHLGFVKDSHAVVGTSNFERIDFKINGQSFYGFREVFQSEQDFLQDRKELLDQYIGVTI